MAVQGKCPPLSNDVDLWKGLTATYAATEEVRHSLVHRHAEVDKATGDLTGHDRGGRPLGAITAAHQESFCRAVQRAADAVVANALSPRERSDFAWNLDQLAYLHGQPMFGGQEIASAPLGVARAHMNGEALLIDAPALLKELRANFPDRAAYDASFELPDGRHLLIELEQAPQAAAEVDLGSLPSWAVIWEGPT